MSNSFLKLRKKFRAHRIRRMISSVVFFLLFFTLVLILIEIFQSKDQQNSLMLVSSSRLQSISIQAFIFITSLWVLVYFLTFNVLVTMAILPKWPATVIDFLSRVLAAIPTVFIAATLVVVVDSAVGIPDSFYFLKALIVLFSACISAIPTVLQTTYPVVKEFQKADDHSARALGISNDQIVSKFIRPYYKRPHLAGVSIAISRVIVESAIVLGAYIGTTKIADQISSSKDIFEILTNSYTAVSVQSNIYLILILILMSIFSRLWTMGYTLIIRP